MSCLDWSLLLNEPDLVITVVRSLGFLLRPLVHLDTVQSSLRLLCCLTGHAGHGGCPGVPAGDPVDRV